MFAETQDLQHTKQLIPKCHSHMQYSILAYFAFFRLMRTLHDCMHACTLPI
jgi:hypothetical protein